MDRLLYRVTFRAGAFVPDLRVTRFDSPTNAQSGGMGLFPITAVAASLTPRIPSKPGSTTP